MAVAEPVQVRHCKDQFLEMLHAQRLDLLALEHGDAGSELRRGAFAEIGGHDDYLQHLVGGRAGRQEGK